MIFLTVGTQLPFNRLVAAVDAIAPQLSEEIFGQVAEVEAKPRNFPSVAFLDPTEYRRKLVQCRVMVSHAGVGSVLGAIEQSKPLVIMPRLAVLGEHRNDHQTGTARQVRSIRGIYVVSSTEELCSVLMSKELVPALPERSETAHELTKRIRHELVNGLLSR